MAASVLSMPCKLQMTNVDSSVAPAHVTSLFQHFGLTVVSVERLFLPTTAAVAATDGHRRARCMPMPMMVVEFASGDEAAVALRAMDLGTVNGQCVRMLPMF